MKFLFFFFIISFGIASQAQVVEQPVEELATKPTEEDLATQYIQAGAIKIRVVGGEKKEDIKTVDDIDLGRVVQVDSNAQQECSLILEAQEIAEDVIYGNGSLKLIPNLPDLKDILLQPNRPVMIAESCTGTTCLWNVLFQGNNCILASQSSGYYLSSMKEALSLPLYQKARLLRIEGTCETSEKAEYNCSVPYGDPRANPGGKISIPHGWSGRDGGLNFTKAQNDEPLLRYTPEDFEVKEITELEKK